MIIRSETGTGTILSSHTTHHIHPQPISKREKGEEGTQKELIEVEFEEKTRTEKKGLNRELNPGPPPVPGIPEEGIILLDH